MKRRCSIFIIILAVLISSCKKDIDTIGLNLQDGTLGNAYVEIPLSAYSTVEDSLFTKNLLYTLLGEIHDPVFGTTKAGFCAQFALQGSNTTFGDNLSLDSVVLTLQYGGYYGDTLSGLHLEVYELNEALTNAQYYSNENNPSHLGNNLVYSSATVLPMPNSRVRIDTTTHTAHMRIRLSNNFGSRLLNLDENDLTNNSAFQSAFKGLVVMATANGTGNLCYFSPTAALSGITLYYKSGEINKKYTFPITTDCARYNFFTHDYSTADPDFQRQVINGDTSLGKETLYIQPTGGVKTHINLDAFGNWVKDKNIVINKAELIITNTDLSEHTFSYPGNIGLQLVNADNTTTYVPDDAVYTSTSYFGGTYDADKKEYRFRLTYYAQGILRNQGINDNGLNIVVTGSGIRGNRLVFRGTDESYTDRLRLAIYYTEY